MASQSGGIIGSAMSQGTDPNAPTSSTPSNTNPSTSPSSSGGTSPSDFMGQLNSSAAPAASSSGSGQSAPASNISNNPADWYTSDLGRAADTSGLDYWNGVVASPGADINAIHNEFLDDAAANQENLSSSASSNLAGQDQVAALKQENAQLQANFLKQKTTVPQAAVYSPTVLSGPAQLGVGSEQTVQGQLKNIMDPNNPIIMQAMTAGKQAANASGLLNSSIAIGAAQDSAYKAAIPIAEQDAGTYNNDYATNTAADNAFSVNNQNAINAAGQFNAGSQNTLTGQQIAANASTSNAQTAANASTSNAQTAAASAQQIAQLNNTNTTNIQSASNTQQAAAQYQTALTNISSFNMDAQSKYDAELNAFNAYKNAVSLMDQKLGVPDLSGQLQFNEVNPSTGSVPSTGVQS